MILDKVKVVLFANTDWYLYNFRLSTAKRLVSLGYEVVAVSPEGEYGQRFGEHGVRWVAAPMNRAGLNPLSELAFFLWWLRFLSAEHPGVVHSFTIKCAVYGGLACRLKKGIRSVAAVAGLGHIFTSESFGVRLLRGLVSQLMKFAFGGRNGLVVFQNSDDLHLLTSRGVVTSACARLIRSSGVDTTRFYPASQVGCGRLRVLFASRLLVEKGVVDVVEAARLIRARGRAVDIVIAGAPDPGNPNSISAETLAEWHLSGVINSVGHVDDMAVLLRSADVFVLPSYYREGVPKCLIEAGATGLALITTDLPGCREVVTDDCVDGLHVRPRNPSHLAELIERLDDDRELLRMLGERARKKVVEEFDEMIVLDRTVCLYREMAFDNG